MASKLALLGLLVTILVISHGLLAGKVPYHQFINMKSQHPNVIQYGVPGGLYINWLHSLNCPLGTKYIRGICRRVFYDNIKTISC
ncbi:hypothetical protein YQE_00466, partial [Dendroctonus ponderosae]